MQTSTENTVGVLDQEMADLMAFLEEDIEGSVSMESETIVEDELADEITESDAAAILSLEDMEPKSIADAAVLISKVPKKEKKAKVAKTAEPKEPKVVAKTREEFLALKAAPDFYMLSKNSVDTPETKNAVIDIVNGFNVKTSKKALNLFAYLNGKEKLSVFTKLGLDYIVKAHEITSKDFVAFLESQHRNGVKSYGHGTAAAQATNLLNLFVGLKMLSKNGGKYTLNENSTIIDGILKTR
jgi:hypothetical protein